MGCAEERSVTDQEGRHGNPDAPRGRVWLIDLHRLGHHRWTWPLWLAKDLAQLWYSSEIPGVETRDRVAFWRAYHKAHPAARWLRWLIRAKAWTYRRHSTRGGRRSLPEQAATAHAQGAVP